MSRMMHLFRKYQYMLLIVFGVLLMFVFVIGDALTNLIGGGGPGRSQAKEIVLTWKHGAVSASDLYSQRVRHNMAVEFLSEVVQETVRREGTPKGPGVYRDQFGRYNPGIAVAASDEGIVQKMLLAAKAESLGVKVDNDAVKAFLYQLSDGELTDNDLAVIYNKTLAGRMTQQHLMDQLQHELLAQQMQMMTQAGLFVVPPREAWQYHNRMRRRVQTEMVALRVDDYKDQVDKMPTETQIEQLYEEGKDRFPHPYSPEPGFQRRRKLAFEYVRADSGKLQEEEAAKIKDAITDEEIEKYYEENKDRYRVIDLPESDPPADAPAAEPQADAEDKDQPAGEPKESKPSEDAAEKPDDAAAKREPAEDDAAPKPAADETPATEKPADSESDAGSAAAEPAGDQPAAADEDENCSGQADTESAAAEPAAAAESPAAEPPAGTEPKDEPPAAAEKSDEPAPPAPEAAKESPAAEKTEAPDKPPAPPAESAEPATEAPAETSAETKAAEEKPDEPKYKPLDDALRAEIRSEIAADRARQPAQERLEQAFGEIKSEIDAYARQLRRTEVEKAGAKPTPVDYEALAAEHGFTAGKIDPTDALGIQEYDLGKAYEMTFTSWPPQRVSFAQMAYLESVQLYRAQRIKSAELDVEFLYWVVDEVEGFVPKLEDIRDEVVDAWKHREALAIAKAEAEKLAKQADPDKPLGESLGGRDGLEVIQPPPFSWMSTGSTPFGGAGAPTLSEVEGVEAAGSDFMKSVFRLRPGETGVAIDQPHKSVYVVRIAAEIPSEEVLKEQFLASGVTPEISQIAYAEIEDLWQAWYQDLEQEMNLKWRN